MVEEFERIMAVRAHFILPDGRIGAAICSRRLSRVNWRLHHRGATGGMDASAKAQERWRDIGAGKGQTFVLTFSRLGSLIEP